MTIGWVPIAPKRSPFQLYFVFYHQIDFNSPRGRAMEFRVKSRELHLASFQNAPDTNCLDSFESRTLYLDFC